MVRVWRFRDRCAIQREQAPSPQGFLCAWMDFWRVVGLLPFPRRGDLPLEFRFERLIVC